jgi:Cu/Ag efflux pump CusA
LVTATLLTLIVLPALYLIFERLSKPGWRRPTRDR